MFYTSRKATWSKIAHTFLLLGIFYSQFSSLTFETFIHGKTLKFLLNFNDIYPDSQRQNQYQDQFQNRFWNKIQRQLKTNFKNASEQFQNQFKTSFKISFETKLKLVQQHFQ